MEEEVIECVGIKGGKLFSSGDGYFYAVSVKKSAGIKYLRCKTRLCRGGAKLVQNRDRKILEATTQHSDGCEPDVLFLDSLRVRNIIMERYSKETTPLKRIFNEECNRVAPNIAAQLSYCQIVSTMKRMRRKNVPPIPTDYRQLNEYMNGRFSDEDGTHYYHTVLGEEDTCMVFASPRRTNNCLETFHHQLFDCVGKAHPNIWEFTG
ncbi:hypothetical protein J6590_039605 [Homalodisca vitripennis]|nr:hypothetical protein J6590_039605 [Homalodisca vitripennis]